MHAARASVSSFASASLLLCLLAVLPARPARAEERAAIAAVPVDPAVPAALAARVGAILPRQLTRAGFFLMDQAMVDLQLAERPELVMGCQRERDVCLVAQARVLGVRRLVLPRLAAQQGGLGIALMLFDVVPASPPEPARVDLLAETVESCAPCQGKALDDAVARAATALHRAADEGMGGQVVLHATPASAELRVDGRRVGVGSAELRLSPGEHLIEAISPDGRSERRVQVGAREKLKVDLLVQGPEPPPQALGQQRRSLGAVKWTLGVVGVVALAAGSVLWALDGRQGCELMVPALECPTLLDTGKMGIAIFSVGAASLVTSGILFGVDYRRGREETQTALLQLTGRF
jgi:hypothetical protein